MDEDIRWNILKNNFCFFEYPIYPIYRQAGRQAGRQGRQGGR